MKQLIRPTSLLYRGTERIRVNRGSLGVAGAAACLCCVASAARAGATLTIDDQSRLEIGIWAQGWYQHVERLFSPGPVETDVSQHQLPLPTGREQPTEKSQLVAAFTEVESGKLNARPQLEAALRRCRQTRAILVVGKLDRLSRNAAFLLSLRDAGVKFVAADMPDMNEAVVGIMAVMAQAERKAISDRTKAALAARRARGLSLGTPRNLSAYQLRASQAGNAAKAARANKHATDMADMIEAARTEGAQSLRAVAAYLNQHEATTSRGRSWTAAAVQRVLRRMDAVR